MPGKRYLLDTNALVALLQGNQEFQAIVLTNDAQLLKLATLDSTYAAQGFATAS